MTHQSAASGWPCGYKVGTGDAVCVSARQPMKWHRRNRRDAKARILQVLAEAYSKDNDGSKLMFAAGEYIHLLVNIFIYQLLQLELRQWQNLWSCSILNNDFVIVHLIVPRHFVVGLIAGLGWPRALRHRAENEQAVTIPTIPPAHLRAECSGSCQPMVGLGKKNSNLSATPVRVTWWNYLSTPLSYYF